MGLCAYGFVYMGALSEEAGGLDPLELELQVLVSSHTQVLGEQLKYFVTPVCVLNL